MKLGRWGFGFLVVIFGIAVFLGLVTKDAEEDFLSSFMNTSSLDTEAPFEQAFARDGLITNTSIRSIELEQVLSGGPGKDGIPAINNPTFVSLENAPRTVTDDVAGIVVSVDEDTRFYPYSILVWHEIVNDIVGGVPVAVTFCPLCGSAIVFEREIDGTLCEFGVSGKLFESNLLMYDSKTESLWSQARGEAVVGEKTGTTLTHFPSQVMTFAEAKQNFTNLKVLSDKTGYSRDYSVYPYGNYEEGEALYFPVSVQDRRFRSKAIMYVVPFKDNSVAFPLQVLETAGVAEVSVSGEVLTAVADGKGTIVATDTSGAVFPGYHEMWFSWATHHQEDGIVWTK